MTFGCLRLLYDMGVNFTYQNKVYDDDTWSRRYL